MELFLIIQLIVSVLLIVVILLQKKGASLGAGFGGAGDASFENVRRGSEKQLYYITIFLALLFLILSISHLFV